MPTAKREAALEQRVEELQDRCIALAQSRDVLEDENANLKAQNKKLSQKRQMEEEMIAHKLKMREETVELDADKRVAEATQKAEKKATDAIAKVKDEYQDKLIKQLEERGTEIKEMYEKILERLPDVNLAIKQKS